MLVRGHNALRSSRALFGLPSLVRYRGKIKEEPEPEQKEKQKPKERQTTRPWPSGLQELGAKLARPIPADPSSTFTMVNIPNASTAYERWPTLKNFKPALQPRTCGTIRPGAGPGGGATVDTYMELSCLPYLYNDLGVMIFEGPHCVQVKIMSNILRSVECEECRLQDRDWTTGKAYYEVNYSKWNVYRIKLDPAKHVETSSQNGRRKSSITPDGLYDLNNIALEKWKADGIGGPVPVETLPGSMKMYILNHTGGPGLANDTINGSYLPQLHVYVATGIRGNTIYMCVEFHTVGTRRLVGVTYLRLRPTFDLSPAKYMAEEPLQRVDGNTDFDQKFATIEEKKKAGREADPYSEKQAFQPPPPHARSIESPWEFYEKLVPSNTRRNSDIFKAAMFELYKLEMRLWSQRKRAMKKEKEAEVMG
ncbi:hypothetical protein BKA60DRAFT_187261 [Fusarium oxysporum]|uniref:Uncharacterized protein n=1 Tax=Fusarium oxysporum TaxID=5507 RepID=A0A420NL87_FUSOX|nr:hypothetical protein BKA60DRAFT_187261 [Fusarium oxysporum]RKK81048.1 hypothetical protein BFJ69_g3960 [Fusarium oxysporum]